MRTQPLFPTGNSVANVGLKRSVLRRKFVQMPMTDETEVRLKRSVLRRKSPKQEIGCVVAVDSVDQNFITAVLPEQ